MFLVITKWGGLIGNISEGNAKNNYSLGFVGGNIQVGGLMGKNTGTQNNNYWNVETSEQDNDVGNSSNTTGGVTTYEMLVSNGNNDAGTAFKNWAASGVWKFGTNNDYPIIDGSTDFEDLQAASIAHGLLRISGVGDESDDVAGYEFLIKILKKVLLLLLI